MSCRVPYLQSDGGAAVDVCDSFGEEGGADRGGRGRGGEVAFYVALHEGGLADAYRRTYTALNHRRLGWWDLASRMSSLYTYLERRERKSWLRDSKTFSFLG